MNDRSEYECIDRTLGDQIWKLEDPATPATIRDRLETHCEFCRACQELLALESTLKVMLRDGSLSLDPDVGARPRRTPWLLFGGGLTALAASVVLVLSLPPHAPERQERGEAPVGIVRPYPDEVVLGGTPEILWTPLAGARLYEVEVSEEDGSVSWQGRTEDHRLRIPSEAGLSPGRRYRVAVDPVPSYTGPGGGLRESFVAGSVLDFVAYRVSDGWLPGRWLAMGSAVVALAGLVWSRMRR